MFRVKICGITSVADALDAAAAGADAIGLNFYSASPRFCPPERARQITSAVPRQICKVGVFVNASANEIRAIFASAGLDLVQLHGDEPVEVIAELADLPVMKAFRVDNSFLPVAAYLDRCRELSALPRCVLVDAYKPGQFGGTGKTIEAHVLLENRESLGGLPVVLAGGLTYSNVAAAIMAVRPSAVDVASGVESSPGQKSSEQVRAFVTAARAAFAEIEPADR
jgi:phosphoribosylanthranilate isomerase